MLLNFLFFHRFAPLNYSISVLTISIKIYDVNNIFEKLIPAYS